MILAVVCLLPAEGADTTACAGWVHAVGVNLRPAYVMPTHSFYRGRNDSEKSMYVSGSVHFQYSFSLPETHPASPGRPSASQGAGLALYTFGADDMTGTPAALYVFQNACLATLGPRLSIDYEWNLGLSAGWKVNEVVGAPMNAYINVGLLMSYRFAPRWTLTVGPDYTHFSNGDTRFPNGGANTFGLRFGVRRDCGTEVRTDRKGLFTMPRAGGTAGRISWDIVPFGSWRADRMVVERHLHLINEAFPILGLHVNPLYHFGHCISAGVSADFTYDRSANLTDVVIGEDGSLTGYSFPSALRQMSAGLSLRGEIAMPVFAVNVGVGCNLLRNGEDIGGLYTIFHLKAFVSERLFLHVGYRLSGLQYTHNMMFGIGLRLG